MKTSLIVGVMVFALSIFQARAQEDTKAQLLADLIGHMHSEVQVSDFKDLVEKNSNILPQLLRDTISYATCTEGIGWGEEPECYWHKMSLLDYAYNQTQPIYIKGHVPHLYNKNLLSYLLNKAGMVYNPRHRVKPIR